MYKSLATSLFLLCIVPLAISLACNMPFISNTGAESTLTSLQQTLTGQIPTTQDTITPTLANTLTVPAITLTNTVVPTITSIPPTSTNTTIPTPCNQAQFVSDVNYPDGTEVIINTTFTKTWRLTNTGSCTWTSGYKLIFDSGDRMSAPDETVLTTGSIPPGATADISVQLKAPSTIGTYKGYFRLKSPDNVVFGINGAANEAFWLQISAKGLTFIVPKLPNLQLIPSKTPTPIKLVPKLPILKVTLKFP